MTNLPPYPPNESGSTMCIVRWLHDTVKGWIGSWDQEATPYALRESYDAGYRAGRASMRLEAMYQIDQQFNHPHEKL